MRGRARVRRIRGGRGAAGVRRSRRLASQTSRRGGAHAQERAAAVGQTVSDVGRGRRRARAVSTEDALVIQSVNVSWLCFACKNVDGASPPLVSSSESHSPRSLVSVEGGDGAQLLIHVLHLLDADIPDLLRRSHLLDELHELREDPREGAIRGIRHPELSASSLTILAMAG